MDPLLAAKSSLLPKAFAMRASRYFFQQRASHSMGGRFGFDLQTTSTHLALQAQ